MIRLKSLSLSATGRSVCSSRLLGPVIWLVLGTFLLLQAAALVSASGMGLADNPIDLADEPLMAKIKPAPANIMFLLDDSGSMTFEVLVAGYYDGKFPNPDEADWNGYSYIFDYLGDNAYTEPIRFMGDEGRKYWHSQFFETNVMYYNPATTYEPWPGYPGRTFAPADKEHPLPHPFKTGVSTLDLDGASFFVTLEAGPTLAVKHAHYFLKAANSDVYLVVIDGVEKKILYYLITQFEGTGLNQKVKTVRLEPSPPSDIVTGRSYDQERQNFANWFTYYRRREYVAKNAMARVIKSLNGVRVGILGINGKIVVPLKPVGVWQDGVYHDQTPALLAQLYAYDSRGGTPLKEGLDDVGKYYRDNSKCLKDYCEDDPPYYPEVDGGACQQSFTVIVTDGYYSDVDYAPQANNADGDKNSTWDGWVYGDDKTNTLADVAMYYYENDLSDEDQGGMADLVYDKDRLHNNIIDTAPHQHMVTYGVAFGVAGNLNPDDYNHDPTSEDYLKDADGRYPAWPTDIGARSKETIDDLYHATVNGRGDFLTAGNPQQLSDALVKLMNNILNRLGSSSSVSINGDSLYGKVSDSILVFQASYQTGDWSGDVKAFGVDTLTGSVQVDVPKWSAAASLDRLADSGVDARNILSFNGGNGIVFVYDAGQMTAGQRQALGWDGITGSASELEAENVVNFIRGHAIEGFRSRNSRLGDIIHASPVFENNVLYVGANDGMLHAFEINVDDKGNVDGNEIFAYIPSFVYQNLAALTDTAYSHKYFVDLTPTVIKGTGLLGGAGDETMLVGGLGRGGKGCFALDITAPQTMGTNDVLWEFPNDTTPEDDKKDMGYSFSKPVVVRSNDEAHAWIVIFGNGYDSPSGRAVLFVLNPTDGKVIQKIIADNPDIPALNGLSSPTPVDVNLDGKVDFVFAGDLLGNMWKFDLTAENSAQWAAAYTDGSGSPQPLFTARGPGGTTQPITSKPEVMLHPQQHGLMVLFGTGRFLGNSDFTNTGQQTVYGIWDYGDRVLYPGQWGRYSNDDDSEYLGAFNREEPNQLSNQPDTVSLLKQTSVPILDEHGDRVGTGFRVMSGNEPTWKTETDPDPTGPKGEPNLPDLSATVDNHAGWYWDLPLPGERVISDVLLRDGRLIVIGFTPDPNPCSAGGTSFLMELNAFNGGSFGGSIFDLDDNLLFNTQDMVIIGYDEKTRAPIMGFPAGVKMQGNIQPPAILRLNKLIEVKYLSSSTGAVYKLNERAVRLGITYWKELEQ